MASDRDLHAYITRYVEIVTRIHYGDLSALQPPPYANLAHGGGGTAYALHRIAEARREASLARRARSWLADARADRRRGPLATSSYLFGRAGLHALRARLEPRARGQAVTDYLGACRTVRRKPTERHSEPSVARSIELMSGTAGQLVGACAMLREFDDARLQRFAMTRAAGLLDQLQRRARSPWHLADATNLAHGWPGALYAVLEWHELAALAPPTWLVDALIRLSRVWRVDSVSRRDMRASWCTGAAGMVLLWAKVFKLTREPTLRRAARAAGDAAYRHADPSRRHLCCGTGGVAHALLALETIDPDRGWRPRARQLAAGAIGDAAPSRWPSGLLWGHPGLVCLALDLIADAPGRFPGL